MGVITIGLGSVWVNYISTMVCDGEPMMQGGGVGSPTGIKANVPIKILII